jgi:hypothetical protein
MSQTTITLKVTIDYTHNPRYFDAEDVAFLAKEGIETHYEVREIEVVVVEDATEP